METIMWVQPKMFSRHYLFGAEGKRQASFKFVGTWNNDAVYTSDTASYFFKMRSSFKNEIDVLENGVVVADVSMPSWGKHMLRLPSGRWYTLASDSFSNSYRWISEGEVVASYSQGIFESKRGTIQVSEKMPTEDKELLVSTGFFLKQHSDQTVVLLMLFLIIYIVIF